MSRSERISSQVWSKWRGTHLFPYDVHMKTLYPEIEPFDTGRLRVSPVHELYYEQCGNPNGKPVVFLHGGPGGGIIPDYRRYFDHKSIALCFLISVARETALHMRALKTIRPGIWSQTSNVCASISELSVGRCLAVHGAARWRWRMLRNIRAGN